MGFITTFVSLVLSIILFEILNLDIIVQNYFYNFQLHSWLIDRENGLLRFVFYDGIKAIFVILFIIGLISIIAFRNKGFIKKRKAGLYIVLLSVVLVPGSVNLLKATTNIPCPKDTLLYQGELPYVSLLSSYPDDFMQTSPARCYPAGHASGGFALLSLVFLFASGAAKRRVVVLVLALSWSVGLYKMLIGDHFLSHTIVSMLWSWLVILSIKFLVMQRMQGGSASIAQAENPAEPEPYQLNKSTEIKPTPETPSAGTTIPVYAPAPKLRSKAAS